MKYSLILLITSVLFASCQKELSMEGKEIIITPTPGEPTKELPRYQLRAFYSDIPIDFIESDDTVKSETDLWSYVNEYIKDDIDELNEDSGRVTVYQNEMKIPGNDDEVISRSYRIGVDIDGQYMQFLGPEYELLHYRLQEFTEDYFIIYLKWKHGSTIYSRFERVR